ncbi:MAG TPA: ECF-type sigma factor [Candidatus Angelobacter sp.]|nr:ECF-type sigma factor [Candidatus Angelobacter sp.]
MAAGSITLLVHEYANGDEAALDRLPPLVHSELRRIAQKHLQGERPGHRLQPTALVHEMYARLAGQAPPNVRDRVHFLSMAAHVMRQILIDHRRTKYAQKRGARQKKLSLDEARGACMEKPAIMIRIDDALSQLARHDPQKARLVEMRFFGGLTAEESAAVPALPVNVIRRDLRVAQAWLRGELNQGQGGTGAERPRGPLPSSSGRPSHD